MRFKEYTAEFPVSHDMGDDLEEWPVKIREQVKFAAAEIEKTHPGETVDSYKGWMEQPAVILNPGYPYKAVVKMRTRII